MDYNHSQLEEENNADFGMNQDNEIVLHEMNDASQRTGSLEGYSSENCPQIEPIVSESESRQEERPTSSNQPVPNTEEEMIRDWGI